MIKVGQIVKNKITGQRLGKVSKIEQITVLIINGSMFFPQDVEVIKKKKRNAS